MGVVSEGLWIAIAVIAVLLVAALVVGLVRYRRRRISLSAPDTATPIDRSGGYTASSGITFSSSAPPAEAPVTPPKAPERLDTSGLPAVGDDATIPRDAPKRPIADVKLPEPPVRHGAAGPSAGPGPSASPAPSAGARARCRRRPSPSRPISTRSPRRKAGWIASAVGSRSPRTRSVDSMLGLLGGGDLDEDSWEEVEDTLLIADLGPVVTESVVTALRAQMASSRVRTEADARSVLREVLIVAAAARSGPLDQGPAARRQTVGAAGRRGQRNGQDHDRRQARARSRRRRPSRRARRGRHVPCRGGRPTPVVGLAGRR